MPSTKDLDNPVPGWIIERMAAKHHKPAEAAREIGTTQAALQYILDRQRGLGKDLAPRVAAYLGMDQAALFRAAGLSPRAGQRDAEDDFHESQLRVLFRRMTQRQKRQIVDIADVIIQGDETAQNEPTKAKSRNKTT